MFKKMIALMALVAMLVAGFAFAGDHEYKIYGKLHSSINYLSDSEDSQLGISSNTSRFGFKGSKDLDNDMTLIWQFESGINIAQKGANTLATRNTFLGMSGEWGTFLYGIHDTPFKIVGRKVTFFKDTIGDFRNVTLGTDLRLQDVAVYVSPNFDGFGFIAAYQFDQGPMGADEATTALSACAHYKKDALYLGAAVEQWSKGYAGFTNDNGTPADPSDDFMDYGEAQMAMRFVGMYDFGQFALSGLFQTISDFGGTADLSAQTMGLEGKFAVNDDYTLKGSYYMVDPNTDTDDNEFAQLALGVDKNLGASSLMYLQFATGMNGDAMMWGLGNGNGFGDMVGASAAGESPMGFSVGWITKFH